MFCPKCGAQNVAGNAFCSNCGTPFTNSAPSAPREPQTGNYTIQNQNYPPQGGYGQTGQPGYYPGPGYSQTQVMSPPRQKMSRNTIIGIGVVAGAVVIVALILILIFTSGGGNSLTGSWTLADSPASLTMTFKSDGTMSANMYGSITKAKYMTKGNVLTTIDEKGIVESGTYRIFKDKGKTALEITFDGSSFKLYRK